MLEDEIKRIEEEIRNTPYNKASSHHIGRLKARLAKLREEAQRRVSTKAGGGGFSVKKSGDATIVLVGYPSVGKSTLLNRLTGAQSRIGDHAFTTLEAVPGVLNYMGAKIQVLDGPGLLRGAASGRGRGREVIALVRNADLALLLVDVYQPEQYEVLFQELYDSGIRLNSKPPEVTIKKKERGGIIVSSAVCQNNLEDIRMVLREYKMHNVEVLIREKITLDRFVDALEGNRKYMPAVIAVNKIDLASEEVLQQLRSKLPGALLVSAEKGLGIEALKEEIYNKLGLIRVFLKPQGGAPDLNEPMIFRISPTVGDICDRIHRDFRARFRYAQVWGRSAKHEGQRAGLDHMLMDGDILTLVLRK